MKYTIIFLTASLFIAGCATQNTVQPQIKTMQTTYAVSPQTHTTQEKIAKKVPQRPKRVFQPKKVEDDNFSPEYMYPDNKPNQKVAVTASPEEEKPKPEAPGPIITKEECIAMIGQEKFDKYTEMFGNEEASIKRCAMIRQVQQ